MISQNDLLPLFAEVCPRRESETSAAWHRRIAREFSIPSPRVQSMIYDKRLRLTADDISAVLGRVLKHRGAQAGETLRGVELWGAFQASEVTKQERELLHDIEQAKAALDLVERRLIHHIASFPDFSGAGRCPDGTVL